MMRAKDLPPGAIVHITVASNTYPHENIWVVVDVRPRSSEHDSSGDRRYVSATVIIDHDKSDDQLDAGKIFLIDLKESEGRVVPDDQVPPDVWALLAKMRLQGEVK